MKILHFEQGGSEWFAARIGSLGGSSMNAVMAKGEGKTRKQLMYRMVGEILTGTPYEGYTNANMERGTEQESEARLAYEMVTGTTVERVGMFVYGPHTHCSPDGVVGDGTIEIKCVIPSVQVETILSDRIPATYRKQTQWSLVEKEWCDFVSYSPLVKDRPIWIKRVFRNETIIAGMMAEASIFIEEMLAMVEAVKREV